MRHEVRQGEKVILTTESGKIELPFVRVRGGTAMFLLNPQNGPVQVEIVPMHPGRIRGKHSKLRHRRQRPGTIGAEE